MTKFISLFCFCLLLLSASVVAQSVENGNLENWEVQNPNLILVKENPSNWTTRNHVDNNPQAIFCSQTNDSYSGERAAVLENYSNGNGLTLSSFMSLGAYNENNPNQKGVAFLHRPHSMHFAYKYFTLIADPDGFYKSRATIELSRWEETTGKRVLIGRGEYHISNKVNFYQPTEVLINYMNEDTPDSLRIVFSTSNNPDDEIRMTIDDIYLQMDHETVGNSDKVYVEQVNIFPNPVNDWLTFINPSNVEDASLLVYNSIGQLLLEESITGTGGQIDCQKLHEGMYFYQIRRVDELIEAGKLFKH